jgi:hypothetical protein
MAHRLVAVGYVRRGAARHIFSMREDVLRRVIREELKPTISAK